MPITPIAWHVTARLQRSRVIPNPRGVARVVLDHARRDTAAQLLAFSVPDNHVHLLFSGPRDAVGQRVNHLLGGLTRRLDLDGGFSAAWFGPMETQQHFERTLHYVLRQHQRHETTHDLFREASSLPDLLGLRPLGGFLIPRVLRELPRLRRGALLGHLGVRELKSGTMSQHLHEAAAAVIAAPNLQGNSRPVAKARVAAAHWGRNRGLSARWLADHLHTDPRSVRRCLSRQPDRALVQAIGLQVGLRETLVARSALCA